MLNTNYKHKRLLLCVLGKRTIRDGAVNNDKSYFAIITQFDFENERLILQ